MPGSTLVLCDSCSNVNGIFMSQTSSLCQVARQAVARLGYNAVSTRWRALFGRPSRKVPLDAGFSCPNRDGTLATGGCVFCNAQGSGTGLAPLGLTGQWEFWRRHRQERWGDVALVAYLQSYSNTYGPFAKLKDTLEELAGLPGLEGLCLATRPDCVDERKMALLADFPTPELWLELGLQSSNPATLSRINRGHDPACFERAALLAGRYGVKVCVHLIAGLPGETCDDFSRSISFINGLPVAGIKFHNLFAAHGSALAQDFVAGRFTPLTQEGYLEWLLTGLARLRPETVVHRLSADPAPGELLAPEWAGRKRLVLNAIKSALASRGVRQGMALEDS